MTRDAGAPPTWPVAGSGDNATAVGLYSAIVTALYRRERTGKGSHVTTSLPRRRHLGRKRFHPGALSGAKLSGSRMRRNQVRRLPDTRSAPHLRGSCDRAARGNLAPLSAPWMETLAAQMPSASSEVVTWDPLPVRSRDRARSRSPSRGDGRRVVTAAGDRPGGRGARIARHRQQAAARPVRGDVETGSPASGPLSPKPVTSA